MIIKQTERVNMLEEININNLGIIENTTLEFCPGLNVITGETGAGKTMILNALHLLLGKRSNTNMIKTQCQYGSVQGTWNNLPQNIIEDIENTGAIIEDQQLYINRTLKNDGKNKTVIGGKNTPTTTLAKIGQQLVSIHGQSDQNKLKDQNQQLRTLDTYAQQDITPIHEQYTKLYKQWKNAQKTLHDTQKNATTIKRTINSLTAFIEDYDTISPQPQEDQEIQQHIDNLANIEDIQQNMSQAYQILTNDNITPATTQLEEIGKTLKNITQYDPHIKKLYEQTQNVTNTVYELQDNIETYLNNIDTDTIEELYELQERQRLIKRLVKKYANNLEELIAQRKEAEKELSILELQNQPIEQLQEQEQHAYKKMMAQAKILTTARTKHARTMAQRINQELTQLSMNGHTFIIDIQETEPHAHGVDEVSFNFLTKGQKVSQPIHKTASGGELSRIMLAIEVVITNPDNMTTYVFDEIDSGIGGETAIEIGKRLAKLAKTTQVIVVTHLPQVAAYADQHLKVTKTVHEESITTHVDTLNKQDTTRELTRMLAGMTNSDTGKQHAKELQEHAKTFKETLL